MNPHDWCTQANASNFGLEGAFVLARKVRHVSGCAAHVEADHLVEARELRDRCRADNAARRPGKNRVLTLKFVSVGESAGALHKLQPYIAERRLHLLNIATQNRGQIRVDDRRVATRNKLHER